MLRLFSTQPAAVTHVRVSLLLNLSITDRCHGSLCGRSVPLSTNKRVWYIVSFSKCELFFFPICSHLASSHICSLLDKHASFIWPWLINSYKATDGTVKLSRIEFIVPSLNKMLMKPPTLQRLDQYRPTVCRSFMSFAAFTYLCNLVNCSLPCHY